MADEREIIGWFYKNGRRIPIKAKKAKDKEADKYITKKPGMGPGYEYYSTDYDTSGGHVHADHDTEDEARAFLKRNGVIKDKELMPGREDIKQRALEHKVAKTDRNEVLFINNRADPVRKHAEIVSELPEKTGKFDLGYSKMGTYQYDHGTYDIHHDRNRFDQFSYYAVPKIGRENVKRDPVAIRKAIKQPGVQAIKRVMEERGLNRQEAIKYLMEQRKKG